MSRTWKRLLCLSLVCLLSLGALSGCSTENATPTTEETTVAPTTLPTESPAEAKVLKVLTLGHSLAVDSNHMINLVAATEGIGDYEEILIGTLYYSGCRLSQHVTFIKTNEPAYNLYVSSTTTPDVPPTIMKDVTIGQAVSYEYWDIVVMMGNPWEIDSAGAFENGNIQTIQNYVNENKLNPNAIFAWHMPWATPGDKELLNMYPYEPNSHYNNAVAYGFDKSKHYTAMTTCVEKYILTDETFQFVIPTGTAHQNAWSSYLEDKDLHRDYFHTTDFGRVMASYVWYCMLVGVEELDEIKLDAIPQVFLKSTEDKTQDRVLTEMEKAIILESVNNALKDPMHMTQSQYTVAP